MTTFYVIRHGETLFNVIGRLQGWCDSPLTQEGEQQAISLGKHLHNIPFKNVYSSTSERVQDTTRLVLQDRDVPVSYRKDLKEVNFGIVEGGFLQDLKIKKFKDRFFHGYHEYGGEDYMEVGERMIHALEDIAKANKDEHVLIATHGGAILSMIYQIDKEEAMKLIDANQRIDNCSVTIVHYDKQFTLEEINSLNYR